jgi:C4-dicarboxylate-binding protein DctP
LSKFGPLGVKEFEVFDMPFIFSSYEDLRKVTNGSVGKQLLAKLEPKGIRGLGYWDNGFKSFSLNTPIKTPADLKGKKMRIQSSKVLEEEIRALGGLPQVMAFSEVYQALQTGVVDGTEKSDIQPLHAENARSAEASDPDRARLSGLRSDRQQEVLGWSAG